MQQDTTQAIPSAEAAHENQEPCGHVPVSHCTVNQLLQSNGLGGFQAAFHDAACGSAQQQSLSRESEGGSLGNREENMEWGNADGAPGKLVPLSVKARKTHSRNAHLSPSLIHKTL